MKTTQDKFLELFKDKYTLEQLKDLGDTVVQFSDVGIDFEDAPQILRLLADDIENFNKNNFTN